MESSIVLLLVSAYFLISLTALADKFLISRALPPFVYAFFVSVLGLLILLLIPFGFFVPDINGLVLPLVAGVTYTLAIIFLYTALQHSEASRVYAATGALGAVLTFIFSYFFLAERLSGQHIMGFSLLVLGGILITIDPRNRANFVGLLYAGLTGLCFGVAYTATKASYAQLDFIAGFIWIRIFAVVPIAVLLLLPVFRNQLRFALTQRDSSIRNRTGQSILIAGQAASAAGFLILNYVISRTSAALALAAQGLQYVFLLVATLIISLSFPKIFREVYTKPVLIQKCFAIILVVAGLAIISLNT